MKNSIFLLLLALLITFISCKEKPIEEKSVFFTLLFDHRINNRKIVLDTQSYYNEAKNKYLVNEVKYFISSLQLHKSDGSKVNIRQDGGIHYVDMDYQRTLAWNISEYIPEGDYDAISFIFGMNEVDNYSYRFINPPESNMAWSQLLGGGSHYMMINGKFFQGDTLWSPLNIHLGKGQIYQGSTLAADSIVGFVDNHFRVTLSKSFLIKQNQSTNLTLVMHIDNWFKQPFVYDFNYFGSHIMQNQTAMQTLKENGKNVFSIE